MFRKGRLLSVDDIAVLGRAGIAEVIAARLEPGDLGEDEAAGRIARACAGQCVRTGAAFTGRVNLYANSSGLARISADTIAAINAVDESITIATVMPFTRVEPRQMLATIKIIPFAAPVAAVEKVERLIGADRIVGVAPFRPKQAALILTTLGTTRPQIFDKSQQAVAARLNGLGSTLIFERRVSHNESEVATAILDAKASGADPILVFGASAITDRRDVIPAAIVRAGGDIERFGMPVDPGNLLLLGRLNGAAVIGLPGCARSPKRNGFDFVLERVLADIQVQAPDFAAMGVGGLLSEIATRPQPRDLPRPDAPRAPVITAVVLAAGLASRMGHNKLTSTVRGKPLLRHAVESAVNSHASGVVVVTGNDEQAVKSVLEGLPVRFVRNDDFRRGLSTSLRAGIRAVPDDSDGAIILLGDMPKVESGLIDKMIAAFSPEDGRAICVAAHGGRRGNPVLWSRQFFPDILALEGDVGARHLMAANDEAVCEAEAGNDGPLIDIDTPEALSAYSADAS